MACVTACPSGVRYDRLIEAARTWTEEPPPGPGPGRPGPLSAGTGRYGPPSSPTFPTRGGCGPLAAPLLRGAAIGPA